MNGNINIKKFPLVNATNEGLTKIILEHLWAFNAASSFKESPIDLVVTSNSMMKFMGRNSKMLSIGTFAKTARVSTRNVRYYESIGLLPKSLRSENNYRYYDQKWLERVFRILNTVNCIRISVQSSDAGILRWRSQGDSIGSVLRVFESGSVSH